MDMWRNFIGVTSPTYGIKVFECQKTKTLLSNVFPQKFLFRFKFYIIFLSLHLYSEKMIIVTWLFTKLNNGM